MDLSKLFTVLCAFLLVIALSLVVTVTVVLHNAITVSNAPESTNDTCNESTKANNALKGDSNLNEKNTMKENDTEEKEPSVNVDVLYQRLWIREAGGRIGVFSDEGDLIRTVDVDVATLSPSDQKALREGIYVTSWKELLALIQDYE